MTGDTKTQLTFFQAVASGLVTAFRSRRDIVLQMYSARTCDAQMPNAAVSLEDARQQVRTICIERNHPVPTDEEFAAMERACVVQWRVMNIWGLFWLLLLPFGGSAAVMIPIVLGRRAPDAISLLLILVSVPCFALVLAIPSLLIQQAVLPFFNTVVRERLSIPGVWQILSAEDWEEQPVQDGIAAAGSSETDSVDDQRERGRTNEEERTMSLTVECDVCGKQYRVADKYAGRTLNCKKCRSPMEVPESYDGDDENLMADDLSDTTWPLKSASGQSSSSMAHSGTRRNVVERASGWNRRFLPIGSWLAFIGLGMYYLPLIGLQIQLQQFLGNAQTVIAGFFGVLGALSLFIGCLPNAERGGLVAATILAATALGYILNPGNLQPAAPAGGNAPAIARNHHLAPPPVPGIKMQQPNFPTSFSRRPVQPMPPRPAATPFLPSQQPEVASAGGKQPNGKQTELIGGTGGVAFEISDSQNRPMLGVKLRLGEWAGQGAVSSLEPLFESDVANAGAPTGASDVVRAKPGYAVAGFEVDADQFVNAIRPIFMKWEGEELDTTDTYLGDWCGHPTGKSTRKLAGTGVKIIGVCGRKAAVLDAVGLVVAE